MSRISRRGLVTCFRLARVSIKGRSLRDCHFLVVIEIFVTFKVSPAARKRESGALCLIIVVLVFSLEYFLPTPGGGQ